MIITVDLASMTVGMIGMVVTTATTLTTLKLTMVSEFSVSLFVIFFVDDELAS